MGVYIKGLKIPQSGAHIFALTSSGMVEDVCGLVVGEAVEVKTPHGDLIDRDALIDNIKKAWDWETVNGIDTATALRQTICDVKNAPTVLEAEGKDDD